MPKSEALDLHEESTRRAAQKEEQERRIAEHYRKNPEMGAKGVARYFGVSHKYIKRIIKEES